MKKTLISALTTALVAGAASTTFAAANPFSDMPADHWAYDAVTQLAEDGVIEGYGDGTFRGQQSMTRYELAQMTAKAMARNDLTYADKALVDKLAAEFADELNNLGVRVSNLERNADMVKWNGKLEYTYDSKRLESNAKGDRRRSNDNNLKLRLEPSAEVNEHWHVNARIDGDIKMNDDNNDNLTLKRIWAQGDWKNFQVKLGKFELYTPEDDLVFDDEMSGAQVTFGNELKVGLLAGRLDLTDVPSYRPDFADGGWANGMPNGYGLNHEISDTASIQGITVQYESDRSKFYGGAAYYHLKSDGFRGLVDNFNAEYSANTISDYLAGNAATPYANQDAWYGNSSNDADDANIWSINLGYDFDGSSKLFAAYANNTEADHLDNSWKVIYNYKGAEKENRGTWGAYVAYRYLGTYASIFGTQDAQILGAKGWEIGADWAPWQNVVTTLKYFDGEGIDSGRDAQSLWGRVEFFF